MKFRGPHTRISVFSMPGDWKAKLSHASHATKLTYSYPEFASHTAVPRGGTPDTWAIKCRYWVLIGAPVVPWMRWLSVYPSTYARAPVTTSCYACPASYLGRELFPPRVRMAKGGGWSSIIDSYSIFAFAWIFLSRSLLRVNNFNDLEEFTIINYLKRILE